MTLLNELELKNISGGGFGIFIAIAGFITFAIGVIDGYIRPLKCNR